MLQGGIIDSGDTTVSSGSVLYLDAAQLRSYSGSGATWTDLSGNSRNGTLNNTPTFNTANGGSIVLNGTNQWIAFGSAINTNAAFTLEFWVQRTSNTTPTLFSGTTASGYLQIRMADTNISLVRSFVAELGNFGVGSATLLNTIYQVVVTRTGSSYVAYTNGVQRGTLTTTQTYTTTNTTIGINSSNSEPFTGRIYRFRHYDRVLTATEILNNYNAIKSRFGL
jgi:hypothetical protein